MANCDFVEQRTTVIEPVKGTEIVGVKGSVDRKIVDGKLVFSASVELERIPKSDSRSSHIEQMTAEIEPVEGTKIVGVRSVMRETRDGKIVFSVSVEFKKIPKGDSNDD